MEKKIKKLKLSKETIRNLHETELEMVIGGTDGGCVPPSPSPNVPCKTAYAHQCQ